MQDLWDYRDLGPDAERIWVSTIREVSLTVALEALAGLVRICTFRPSPAEFLSETRSIQRGARESDAAVVRALPPSPDSVEMPEDVRAKVEALRRRTEEDDRAAVIYTPNEDDFDEHGNRRSLADEEASG